MPRRASSLFPTVKAFSTALQHKDMTKPIIKFHLCGTTSSTNSLSIRFQIGDRNHTGKAESKALFTVTGESNYKYEKKTLKNLLGLRKNTYRRYKLQREAPCLILGCKPHRRLRHSFLYWMENKFSLLLPNQANRRHSLGRGWMVLGMGKQRESGVEPAHHRAP